MKKNRFEETKKIKMVMKLRGLTRAAAVEEIAQMDAGKRQAAEEAARCEYDNDPLRPAREFFGEV